MNQYDQEMFGAIAENAKYKGEHDDTANDLKEIIQEHQDRLETRMKRELIAAVL
jgi:hypothetical protein